MTKKLWRMGACCNSIFRVFVLFLARFLFQSSFFSKSRLCTRPLFSHFVTNLDWLAGQLIQIIFAVKIFLFCSRFFMYSSVGSILWEATVWWRRCHRSVAVSAMAASWASAGLTTPIVLRYLCCCCHCLVYSSPSPPLVASLLFGVIVAIFAIATVIVC